MQISNEGGNRPVWSHDGRALFYVNGDKLMRVPIETKTGFAAGVAQQVLQGNYYASGHYYDVLPDGKQFVFIKEMEQAQAATQINLVLNWFDAFKQQMSEGANR